MRLRGFFKGMEKLERPLKRKSKESIEENYRKGYPTDVSPVLLVQRSKCRNGGISTASDVILFLDYVYLTLNIGPETVGARSQHVVFQAFLLLPFEQMGPRRNQTAIVTRCLKLGKCRKRII